jgi:hypothetical protein
MILDPSAPDAAPRTCRAAWALACRSQLVHLKRNMLCSLNRCRASLVPPSPGAIRVCTSIAYRRIVRTHFMREVQGTSGCATTCGISPPARLVRTVTESHSMRCVAGDALAGVTQERLYSLTEHRCEQTTAP